MSLSTAALRVLGAVAATLVSDGAADLSARVARKIAALIAKRGLTQASAAELLKIDQPKVSALVRGRLAGFSLDRLVRFLVLLGSDVEIVVKPRRRATARARVLVA